MSNSIQSLAQRLRAHPLTSVISGILVIVALYLVYEHRTSPLATLPYLLLLACPLMHLFMHGGHRRHTSKHAENPGGSTGAIGNRLVSREAEGGQ
ncbi:DUF2933 domain-containing protein [Sphingobium sp. CECT 9361]|uniref:DUF2933 domain-containing protein n=1 Tax=Sphingobium sp. CECT 9361 TaxID=2845384 RepID=UPI001EF9C025|nr:hypothetical protein SPH9361_01045 [Sphingobium sp. CECT 9361]